MSTLASLNVILNGDVSSFLKSMKQAEDQTSSSTNIISRGLSAIGDVAKVAAGAVVAGVGAMAGAAVAGVAAFNNWAGTLDSLGDVLGTNADESAALAVAIKGVGGDVEGMTGQMAKLAKGLIDDNGKISATGKLAQSMGIAFRDARGHLLPTTTILENVANKLAKLPDGLEKTRIMTALFGKSGKDLSDTMNALANGGLEAARKKAEALGLAIGDEGVNRSIEFGKSIETIKMAAEGVAVSIGSTFMPIVQPAIQKFSEWAVSVMPQVRTGLESVFTWIQTNVGPIVQGVITTFQTAVAWVQTNWPQIQTTVTGVFDQINAFLGPILQGIDSVIRGVFGGVKTFLQTHGAEIKNFLQNAWERISSIVSGVAQIVQTVVSTVFGAIATFLQDHGAQIQGILEGAWNAIRGVVNTALGAIQGIINTVLAVIHGDWEGAWNTFKATVMNVWNFINNSIITPALNFLKGLLETAWGGIKTAAETLWNGLKTIVETAFNNIIAFLISLPARLFEIGKSIIEGLWNGIKSMFENIGKGLSDFFNNAINDIKRSLGIQSPSAVFAAMGTQMMAGLAQGIGRSMHLPQLQLAQVTDDLSAQVTIRAQASLDQFATPVARTDTQTAAQARPMIVNNYIQDALAAKMILEQQRLDALRSVREAM